MIDCLHMQNYTFIAETEVNGSLAYHFRANEKGISGNSGSLYNSNVGGLDMDYYEDVWIDPVTGTILNQKYDIQIKIPPIVLGLGGATLRDIVANYTQDSIDEASSSAKRQALAQYYQGLEVSVLTLNGAYKKFGKLNKNFVFSKSLILPINITVVLLESVKEDICKSSGRFPLKSCPVMNCNLLECNLRVRGILAAAAAAFYLQDDAPADGLRV